MIESAIVIAITVAMLGAVIATYQLARIRIDLGPLFQGSLGVVIAEHILLVALWLVVLLNYALARQFDLVTQRQAEWIVLGLAVGIMLIVWTFVFRVRRAYLRRRHGRK